MKESTVGPSSCRNMAQFVTKAILVELKCQHGGEAAAYSY